MKRNETTLLLAFIIACCAFMYSCRKSGIESSSANVEEEIQKSTQAVNSKKDAILNLLENRKKGLGPNKIKNIQLFKENLDFSKAFVKKRDNGGDLFIIPLKHELVTTKQLNENYQLNLLVVTSANKEIKWARIICYLPEGTEKHNDISPNTIQNIINHDDVEDNGVYKFLDLSGSLLYQLEYRKNKLYSWGRFSTKEGDNAKAVNNTKKTNSTCTNWYLITTYYYSDGSTDQTVEYLYTTCSGCDDPLIMSHCPDPGAGGGGPGSDGPDVPPEEHTIIRDFTLSNNTGGDVVDDEYNDTPDPNASGGGSAFGFSRWNTEYPVTIESGAETGVLISVTMKEPKIYPHTEQYYTIDGQTLTRILEFVPGSGKTWTLSAPHTVYVSWVATIKARYNRLPANTSKLVTYPGSFAAPVTF